MQPLLECIEVGAEDRIEVGFDLGLEVGLEAGLEPGMDGSDRRADAPFPSRCPTDASQNRMLEAIQTRVEKMAAYFGRRCGVDEDDLRQEAWLAVLEMLPRLDYSVGTPEQHLLKRARWRILDTIRRQRRRQHVALDDVPPTMACYLDSRNGIDLGALFARLTVTQQRILRALMEGYTWREVGAIVGCTSANVAYHVRRIREVYTQINGDEEA